MEVLEPLEPQPGTINALADRRLAAERRLAELRRERAVALLDGEPFNSADEIASLVDEIETIEEAEGEATRRDRDAVERAQKARRAVLRNQVILLGESRVDLMTRAEAAALDLMVILQDINTTSEKHEGALRSLGVKTWEATPGITRERIGQYIANLMRPILSGRNTYGPISFPEPRITKQPPWADTDTKAYAIEVDKALNPTHEER